MKTKYETYEKYRDIRIKSKKSGPKLFEKIIEVVVDFKGIENFNINNLSFETMTLPGSKHSPLGDSGFQICKTEKTTAPLIIGDCLREYTDKMKDIAPLEKGKYVVTFYKNDSRSNKEIPITNSEYGFQEFIIGQKAIFTNPLETLAIFYEAVKQRELFLRKDFYKGHRCNALIFPNVSFLLPNHDTKWNSHGWNYYNGNLKEFQERMFSCRKHSETKKNKKGKFLSEQLYHYIQYGFEEVDKRSSYIVGLIRKY